MVSPSMTVPMSSSPAVVLVRSPIAMDTFEGVRAVAVLVEEVPLLVLLVVLGLSQLLHGRSQKIGDPRVVENCEVLNYEVPSTRLNKILFESYQRRNDNNDKIRLNSGHLARKVTDQHPDLDHFIVDLQCT